MGTFYLFLLTNKSMAILIIYGSKLIQKVKNLWFFIGLSMLIFGGSFQYVDCTGSSATPTRLFGFVKDAKKVGGCYHYSCVEIECSLDCSTNSITILPTTNNNSPTSNDTIGNTTFIHNGVILDPNKCEINCKMNYLGHYTSTSQKTPSIGHSANAIQKDCQKSFVDTTFTPKPNKSGQTLFGNYIEEPTTVHNAAGIIKPVPSDHHPLINSIKRTQAEHKQLARKNEEYCREEWWKKVIDNHEK